ncbi:MAG: MBL fold metallo-hydrolase [Candidatus Nitrohelix vancouverensis]|uniref:MBL fold metallo-hydrolase n=1 Tax=Candidatus Nitrohelix vancouverensis TaxID=2705534 RepID=A0A7T0G2D7_9BACT|nr:MAG: MBL fold metallo-hydrolase [Candidatus Nitrohelix vancouverensis]
MVQLAVRGLLVGLVMAASVAWADESKAPHVSNPLTNIYTIAHGGVDSNSTFIITSEGVIVVDTGTTPKEAQAVMDEISKRTDLPVVYTINTHHHGDHVFGNQVFRDGRTIIAHKNVHRFLAGVRGKEHLDLFKTFGIAGMDEVKVTPPNLVYEGMLEIFLGGYHLRLDHQGRGHTDGDTFIFMPHMQAVITGDLVFNQKIPYMGDAYVEDWINSLDYLENLHAETYIPGHGEVGGKPIVIAMKHYLINLRTWVKDEIQKGHSLKEAQENVGPKIKERYAHWKQHDWIDANIERAYTEYSLAGMAGTEN